jgi:hypothetical protein
MHTFIILIAYSGSVNFIADDQKRTANRDILILAGGLKGRRTSGFLCAGFDLRERGKQSRVEAK